MLFRRFCERTLLGFLLAVGFGCGGSEPGISSSGRPGAADPGALTAAAGIAPAAGVEVSLFRHFDIRQHTNRGAASLLDDGLHFTNPAGGCQVYFPGYDPPAEFDLEAHVTRTGGSGSIILGFYAWGQQCRVVLDGETEAGPRSGLAPIDGHWLNQPGYPNGIEGPLLVNNRPATILVQVRRDALGVTLDGREIVRYEGDLPTLGQLRFYTVPAPRAFSLASWKSTFDIPRLVVRPLGNAVEGQDEAAAPRSSPPPQAGSGSPPPAFQFTELPLDAAAWAFAFRQAPGDRWAIDDSRLQLLRDDDGLLARVPSELSTMLVAYRPRLRGDFLIQLQILTPPRGDPDTQVGGGTSVPYIGFRALDPEGRDVTYAVPSAREEPQRFEYRIRREGDVLRATRNGDPLPEQESRCGDACHLFVQLNGPAKVWIQGCAATGGVEAACYGPGQYAHIPPSAEDWLASRPGKTGADSLDAGLRVEAGGVRVENSRNEPLQVGWQRPLRGDFHVTAWMDVLSVSLVERSRSSLQKLYVELGFQESAGGPPEWFAIRRYGEQETLRIDLMRERGELTLLADGQRCGSLRNAADGLVLVQLRKAGAVRLRDVRVEADELRDRVPPRVAEEDQALPAVPAAVRSADSLPLRTWTDATGQFRVQARMVRVEGGTLILEDATGRPKSIPLSRLSRADQLYVRQQRGAAADLPEE